MKKILSILITVIPIMLVCTSCFGNDIVGKWYNGNTGYIIFQSNGDYYVENDNITGTYEVSGSTLTLIDNGKSFDYEYDITDDTLTMSYTTERGKEKKMVYIRKEL